MASFPKGRYLPLLPAPLEAEIPVEERRSRGSGSRGPPRRRDPRAGVMTRERAGA
jgi:hypothetical protein